MGNPLLVNISAQIEKKGMFDDDDGGGLIIIIVYEGQVKNTA
jgi:hypothetical protein